MKKTPFVFVAIASFFMFLYWMRTNRATDGKSPQIHEIEALPLFQDVLNDPRALLNWDSPTRVARCKALFDKVPQIAGSRNRDLITILVAALSAPERSVYFPAFHILCFVTKENHGFAPLGTAEERSAAAEAWRKWWMGVKAGFRFPPWSLEQSTLIVDEMPGRLAGNDEDPPGRVVHLNRTGGVIWETSTLKMPYDAVRLPDGCYLVSIIRERAVWKVSPAGEVVWKKAVGGYPCSLQLLQDGHFLVAGWDDDRPGFVREFDATGFEVWKLESLRWPWKAQRLDNGNTLVADAGENRVFEVDPGGKEAWAAADLGPKEPKLFDALGPVYCQRLEDGHTLISIRGLSKVVEIDRAGKVTWEVGREIVLNQYSAVRLWNGNTLIADQGHFRVIEIDVDKNIVWERKGLGYPAKAYRY